MDVPSPVYDTSAPAKALAHIESARFPALYLFRGLGSALEQDEIRRRLADAGEPYEGITGAIVLTGEDAEFGETLRARVATVRLPPPDAEEFGSLLLHIVRDLNARGEVEIDLTPEERDRLLGSLRGLTLLEAEKVLTRAIIEDGRLTVGDIDSGSSSARACSNTTRSRNLWTKWRTSWR